MYLILTYLVINVITIVISLSLTWYQFYCHFYIDTESISPSLITSNTVESFSSSLSSSLITTTPTVVTPSKWALWIKLNLLIFFYHGIIFLSCHLKII